MKIANISNVYSNSINSKRNNDLKIAFKSCENFNEFSKNSSNAIKNNAIASINFKGDDSQKIKEIELKLCEEYGIDAKFTNLATAKLTLEAVEDFVELNDEKMFEGLNIKPYEDKIDWVWGISSDYNTNKFTLKLNNNFSMQEFKNHAQKNYDNCYTPSSNPKYDFYLALADFLCFKYNPYAYTTNTRIKNFSNSFLEVANKLGANATANFARFNSTYIASRMCGVEIPPDSKRYYLENVGAKLNLPPAKITKSSFDENIDFKTIDEAVEYLKQYGIEAEFENLKLANLTANAIKDFIEINKNPKMFEGLKISSYIKDSTTTIGCMHWIYNHETGKYSSKIEFNKAYDWNRHKNTALRNYFSGHFSSANEKYSIYHELAHWLDFNSRPKEYVQDNNDFASGKLIINSFGKRAYSTISGYATENSLEFVAEYVAARMCGQKFSQSVNDEYKYETNLDLKFPE